jgi:hypothetical protein
MIRTAIAAAQWSTRPVIDPHSNRMQIRLLTRWPVSRLVVLQIKPGSGASRGADQVIWH